MNLFEFSLLHEPEQADLLHREGCFIGKRKNILYNILLYQLDTFYVEIYYLKHRQQISRVRCTSSMKILDPYLTQIPIEELV